MKKLVLVAALAAALGACSQAAEEADDTATTAATEAPAVAETVAATGWAGTYEFEIDGKKTTSVLMPDGKYEDREDGKVTEKGLWAEHEGKVCFDPEGDALGTCFSATDPDADGVFTATGDDGTVLTIKKTA